MSTVLQSTPGYRAAVADESRSHDDVVANREVGPALNGTYQDAVRRLAGIADADTLQTRHLQGLPHAELAAALDEYPEVLTEGIVNAIDYAGLHESITATLRSPGSPYERHAQIGQLVVEAMLRYAAKLILQDVQERVDLNRECARMDRQRDMA